MVIFFFNDTATTEIYTLSLHDALPISAGPPPERRGHRGLAAAESRKGGRGLRRRRGRQARAIRATTARKGRGHLDRKSTRLNSSHANISYAVFCLKKKNITSQPYSPDT